jgi:hypothetical protein
MLHRMNNYFNIYIGRELKIIALIFYRMLFTYKYFIYHIYLFVVHLISVSVSQTP